MAAKHEQLTITIVGKQMGLKFVSISFNYISDVKLEAAKAA